MRKILIAIVYMFITLSLITCTNLENFSEEIFKDDIQQITNPTGDDLTEPIISLISPTNNQLLGVSFEVSGSMYSPIGMSHAFVFVTPTNDYNPQTYPTTFSEEGMVIFTAQVTVTANGWYEIWAQGLDNNGNITNSEHIVVQVSATSVDTTPPMVAITSPVNNAYHSEGNITISGTTVDTSGVAATYLRIGAQVKTNTSSPNNWQLAFNLNEGTHSVIAWAKDNIGNVGGYITNTLNITNISTDFGEIAVYNEANGGTPITTGQIGAHHFGEVVVDNSGEQAVFKITNSGIGNLNITNVSLSGAGATHFSYSGVGASTLSSGESTTFWVNFTPESTGSKSCSVVIYNDDPDESEFTYTVTGIGIEGASPEIAVFVDSTEVADGGYSHEFANTSIGSAATAITVTISNAGATNLTGIGVSLSGTGSAQFTKTNPAVSTLAPDETTTFEINFEPSEIGLKSALVNIASSDGDENPFNITITGTGEGNDTTPPEWAATYPKTDNNGQNSVDFKAKINENGKVFYVIVADGAAAPTVDDITNGKGNSGATPVKSGNQIVSANVEALISISGLSSGTSYNLYAIAQDESTNVQASVSGPLEFTTDAESIPDATLFIVFENWSGTSTVYFPGDFTAWAQPFTESISYPGSGAATNVVYNAVTTANINNGASTTDLEFKVANNNTWDDEWGFGAWTLTGVTTSDGGKQVHITCDDNDVVTVVFNVGNNTLTANVESRP